MIFGKCGRWIPGRIMMGVLVSVLLITGVEAESCFAGVRTENLLQTPAQVKAYSYDWHKIKVTGEESDEADGYTVYRSAKKDGTYRRVYTTENPEKNWYINTNRTPGKTYY